MQCHIQACEPNSSGATFELFAQEKILGERVTLVTAAVQRTHVDFLWIENVLRSKFPAHLPSGTLKQLPAKPTANMTPMEWISGATPLLEKLCSSEVLSATKEFKAFCMASEKGLKALREQPLIEDIEKAHKASKGKKWKLAAELFESSGDACQQRIDPFSAGMMYMQSGEALRSLGDHATATQRYSQAVIMFQRCSQHQMQTQALLEEAAACITSGMFNQAVTSAKSARFWGKRFGLASVVIRSLCVEGDALIVLGLDNKAACRYRQAVRESGTLWGRAGISLLQCLLGMGQVDTVMKALEAIQSESDSFKFLAHERNQASIHLIASMLSRSRGDTRAAIKHAEIASNHAQSQNCLVEAARSTITAGFVMLQVGQADQAHKAFMKAIKLNSGKSFTAEAEARVGLGMAEVWLGKSNTGLSAMMKGMNIARQSFNVLVQCRCARRLAEQLLHMGRLFDASNLLDGHPPPPGIGEARREKALSMVLHGEIHVRRGLLGPASRLFSEAKDLVQDDPMAQSIYNAADRKASWLGLLRGGPDDAVLGMQHCVRELHKLGRDCEAAAAGAELAVCHAALGDFVRARERLDEGQARLQQIKCWPAAYNMQSAEVACDIMRNAMEEQGHILKTALVGSDRVLNLHINSEGVRLVAKDGSLLFGSEFDSNFSVLIGEAEVSEKRPYFVLDCASRVCLAHPQNLGVLWALDCLSARRHASPRLSTTQLLTQGPLYAGSQILVSVCPRRLDGTSTCVRKDHIEVMLNVQSASSSSPVMPRNSSSSSLRSLGHTPRHKSFAFVQDEQPQTCAQTRDSLDLTFSLQAPVAGAATIEVQLCGVSIAGSPIPVTILPGATHLESSDVVKLGRVYEDGIAMCTIGPKDMVGNSTAGTLKVGDYPAVIVGLPASEHPSVSKKHSRSLSQTHEVKLMLIAIKSKPSVTIWENSQLLGDIEFRMFHEQFWDEQSRRISRIEQALAVKSGGPGSLRLVSTMRAVSCSCLWQAWCLLGGCMATVSVLLHGLITLDIQPSEAATMLRKEISMLKDEWTALEKQGRSKLPVSPPASYYHKPDLSLSPIERLRNWAHTFDSMVLSSLEITTQGADGEEPVSSLKTGALRGLPTLRADASTLFTSMPSIIDCISQFEHSFYASVCRVRANENGDGSEHDLHTFDENNHHPTGAAKFAENAMDSQIHSDSGVLSELGPAFSVLWTFLCAVSGEVRVGDNDLNENEEGSDF